MVVEECTEKRSLLSTLAKEPRKKITKRKNKNHKCGKIKNLLYEVYTMANSKITERDIYNSIIDGTADPDVLVEFATKKLAQLDKRNAAAKVRAEKKRAEGDALMASVLGFVTDEPQSRGDIASAMIDAGFEVTDAKVGARLNKLVAAGEVVKANAKVAGEDGKSKTVVVYSLAE